jgi:hypothetical protein
MIKLKKLLKEGYAWERDENGALPTLESSTAKHAESLKESTPDKSNASALKAALVAINDSQDDMASEDLLGAIEDGYYALTDNLPNLINDIQKAIKLHEKANPASPISNPTSVDELKALENELTIYKSIQKLADMSAIGTVL